MSIRKSMAATILGGATVAATLFAVSAFGQGMTMAEKFAADRLAYFSKGDADALVAQYADDAVVITPAGVLRGREQIRAMVEGIVGEFSQPGVEFKLLGQQAADQVVTFTWSATTPNNVYDLGAETYVLEDGKAVYQTFAAKVASR